jgi:hypothetical protein
LDNASRAENIPVSGIPTFYLDQFLGVRSVTAPASNVDVRMETIVIDP